MPLLNRTNRYGRLDLMSSLNTAFSLSKLARRIFMIFSMILKFNYYNNPKRYWENRHKAHDGELTGVGNVRLSDPNNKKDYLFKWEKIKAALLKYSNSNDDCLLDAGCGNGFFTRRLLDLGYDVTAFDLTASGVHQARTRVGEKVALYESAIHNFKCERQFDVVTCIDVLFHVTDDELHQQSFQNLCRLLNPGGFLLIQERLVKDQEVKNNPNAKNSHVRWRSADYYQRQTPANIELIEHLRYDLPVERVNKDLLLFKATEFR